VRVSFDATKIAYGSFLCGSQEYTTYWTPSTSTGLNFPNQTLGQQDFYQPAWQDNNHFLVTHAGPTVGSSQSRWYLHDVAQGDNVGPGWFEPTMTGNGQQGLVSRDGTRLVVFEDDASDQLSGKPTKVHVWVFTAASIADAEANAWTKRCEIALDASKTSDPFHLSPSFSPDGSKLLWADDNGLEIMSIADLSSNCAASVPAAVVPGGSEPFYSKGNMQPAALTPRAAFKIATRHARAGHTVKFDARKSHEAGGRIVSYVWKFGDGKKGKGSRVTHKYKKRGRYTVTLTIADAKGKKASAKAKITVAR
jgi:plastocyanin